MTTHNPQPPAIHRAGGAMGPAIRKIQLPFQLSTGSVRPEYIATQKGVRMPIAIPAEAGIQFNIKLLGFRLPSE